MGRASLVAIQDLLVQSTFYPRQVSVEARRSGGEVQCDSWGKRRQEQLGSCHSWAPPAARTLQLLHWTTWLAWPAWTSWTAQSEAADPGLATLCILCAAGFCSTDKIINRKFLESKVVFQLDTLCTGAA